MVKASRVIMFISAMYMYYIFIAKDFGQEGTIGKLALVMTLLILMEVIRRKSTQTFHEASEIEIIDSMDSDVFVHYVAELYKRIGYQVSLPTSEQKKICDLVVTRVGKRFYLKCFKQVGEIKLEQLNEVQDYIDKNNNKPTNKARFVVVSNAHFSHEIKSSDMLILKDRNFLLRCIEEFKQDTTTRRLHLNLAK
ncbi:MAG: hypothetical protein ATN35_00670 [Epulopiscium sp. Nele67-Bin004]|nr:MAG: hypothetical protein ATN35_00670 [Epulopiscium sp. Nele67-Bin004]